MYVFCKFERGFFEYLLIFNRNYLIHMQTSSDPPPPYSSSYRIDSRRPPETVKELFANHGLSETALAEYVVMVISTAQELQPREPARAAPSEDKALQAQSCETGFARKIVNLFGPGLREAADNSASFRESLDKDEERVAQLRNEARIVLYQDRPVTSERCVANLAAAMYDLEASYLSADYCGVKSGLRSLIKPSNAPVLSTDGRVWNSHHETAEGQSPMSVQRQETEL